MLNPFATTFWASGTIPFQFTKQNENIETVLVKAQQHPICQIVGPHGSGKSTLLLEFLKQYGTSGKHVRYLFFNDQNRHLPNDLVFSKNQILLADGFEQLSIKNQLCLLFRSKRLIITVHRPVWFVPVLYRTQPHFSIFVQLVRKMDPHSPQEPVLREVYERSGGNFRSAFFALYDLWEKNR